MIDGRLKFGSLKNGEPVIEMLIEADEAFNHLVTMKVAEGPINASDLHYAIRHAAAVVEALIK